MFRKHTAAIIALFAISVQFVSSQKLVNSPYSRFNIGSLEPVGSFKSMGMGGVSTGLRDISSVFYTNPASYSSFDTTSFVFDFGLDYGVNLISKSGEKYASEDLNFDHLLMGFPVMRGWGVAIGVVPVSSGYYRIFDTVVKSDPDYDPLTGEYSTQHTGEGSFNNLILGTGFQFLKHFSAGINMTVLFGTIKRNHDVTFGDFFNTFHNNSSATLQLSGINFNYGLQYNTKLLKSGFLTAGVSLSTGHDYGSNYELFSYKSTGYGLTDTISYVKQDKGKAYLPGTIRGGFAIGKTNKWTFAFDYIASRWSELDLPGESGYAADTRTYCFGLEYIPGKFSNTGFLRRIEYRAGAHFGDNYLIINGEQLKESGASIGLGIPMGQSLTDKRSLSRTNIVLDFTRRYGSSSGDLHSENFFTFGVSLNFYDFWFVKRKYD